MKTPRGKAEKENIEMKRTKANETRKLATLAALSLLVSIAGMLMLGRILGSALIYGWDRQIVSEYRDDLLPSNEKAITAVIAEVEEGMKEKAAHDAFYASYMNAEEAGLGMAAFLATCVTFAVFVYCVWYTWKGIKTFLQAGEILAKRKARRQKKLMNLRENIQNYKMEEIAQKDYRKILPEE